MFHRYFRHMPLLAIVAVLARAEARPARGPGPPRIDAARTRDYARKITDEALARARLLSLPWKGSVAASGSEQSGGEI